MLNLIILLLFTLLPLAAAAGPAAQEPVAGGGTPCAGAAGMHILGPPVDTAPLPLAHLPQAAGADGGPARPRQRPQQRPMALTRAVPGDALPGAPAPGLVPDVTPSPG
jgi:hypothetical protein